MACGCRTRLAGDEHAAVGLDDGDSAIVSADPHSIDLSGDVTRLFAHAHPYGEFSTRPSPEDIDAVGDLGQRSSWLIERVQTSRYWIP